MENKHTGNQAAKKKVESVYYSSFTENVFY